MRDLSTDAMTVGIILVILLLLALGITGRGDYEDALMVEQEYCEMVELWGQTNGRDGHPDWRKLYQQVCTSD
jgi:hypothetical protein